jgi:hypothetical protein
MRFTCLFAKLRLLCNKKPKYVEVDKYFIVLILCQLQYMH